jgi:hypothetical protein
VSRRIVRVGPGLTLTGAAIVAAGSASGQAPAGRSGDEVVVLGRWDNPFGYNLSASQGVVGAAEIQARPLLRPGEILEIVPGLIVTQHSGTGKGNQMFLRGFNLDHGTDFATWVDGMPVNMPTHGHGQGYTDINFLIPELVETLEYRKGGYYAEVSDFSSAGAVHLSTYDRLDQGLIKAGFGEYGYLSALAADSVATKSGSLLYGVQVHRYDGAWTDIAEDLKRNNLLLRYSGEGSAGDWNVAFMGYDAQWNSADQIPRRAVESGLISALGSIDPTLGGETSRYSLSGTWSAELGRGRARLNAYTIDYDLSLFSNFTYFLDDPVDGDQFEQLDDRTVTGGDLSYSFPGRSRTAHMVGVMLRHDDIGDVGLFRTANLERLSAVRRDSVDELAFGVYYSGETRWTDRLRTTLGVRVDRFDFDVASDLAANSGSASDSIVAPKANVIYAVSSDTELYLSAGKGFHSNDARGTTITVDPSTGDPADPVSPLVASHQFEFGFRTFVDRRFNVSAALWYLELDSELLFIGDAGNTEASRPSERYGLEVPFYYRPTDRLTLDLELAFTKSQFADFDPAGDEIPGAIDRVVAAGITFDDPNGWYGSVRLRHLGPRPLIEEGSARSDASTLVNAALGFRRDRLDVRLDLLNVFDSDDHDIAYFYGSRLPGEPDDGVEDLHFHPFEPRMLRAYLNWRF